MCKKIQAAFLVGSIFVAHSHSVLEPFSVVDIFISRGALSARHDRLATKSNFQIIASAFSVFLKRREASVRRRTA